MFVSLAVLKKGQSYGVARLPVRRLLLSSLLRRNLARLKERTNSENASCTRFSDAMISRQAMHTLEDLARLPMSR